MRRWRTGERHVSNRAGGYESLFGKGTGLQRILIKIDEGSSRTTGVKSGSLQEILVGLFDNRRGARPAYPLHNNPGPPLLQANTPEAQQRASTIVGGIAASAQKGPLESELQVP